MTKTQEKFISLSGKSYASKEAYVAEKLKRADSKFSLGYKFFDKLIKANKSRTKIEVARELSTPDKKVKYVASRLITNASKGYRGLIKGGDKFRIANPVYKNFTKENGGTVTEIAVFDLVKVENK